MKKFISIITAGLVMGIITHFFLMFIQYSTGDKIPIPVVVILDWVDSIIGVMLAAYLTQEDENPANNSFW